MKKEREKIEFGDFQTPLHLTREICALLARSKFQPAAVVEPTCGRGSFLVAALETFPTIRNAVGLDINPDYVVQAEDALRELSPTAQARVFQGSFFNADWASLLADLPDPLLIIGNPPWVTNSELGGLRSSNLPKKSNFQNNVGLDAITGKSNFDISEWMLIKLLEWLHRRQGTLAMLCKTSVARKALNHVWKNQWPIARTGLYRIDTANHFEATVDACLLVCVSGIADESNECIIHPDLSGQGRRTTIGYRNGCLLADLEAFERWGHIQGKGPYRWRSGVKHDCSSVMELRSDGPYFRNGLDQEVDLEDDYLYPMLKGSEIAKGNASTPSRWMLVTQRTVRENTSGIILRAPKTWQYLERNASLLARRASSIYRNSPRFSVFGVGEYSFAPWKVAVAALYKRLSFTVVGPYRGKPVVFDDTSYFLPCRTAEEANHLALLLNSTIAREFLGSFIFWDAKRPITVEILGRLDLLVLSREIGLEHVTRSFMESATSGQHELFP